MLRIATGIAYAPGKIHRQTAREEVVTSIAKHFGISRAIAELRLAPAFPTAAHLAAYVAQSATVPCPCRQTVDADAPGALLLPRPLALKPPAARPERYNDIPQRDTTEGGHDRPNHLALGGNCHHAGHITLQEACTVSSSEKVGAA